jgi:hypothetical protein
MLKCNSHGNHKENSYRTNTRGNEKEIKTFLTKNQLNTQKRIMQEMKDIKNSIRHTEKGSKMRSYSFMVITLHITRVNSPLKRQSLA